MASGQTPGDEESAGSVMEGQGAYNRFSRPQHVAVDFAVPLLRRAVADLEPPPAGEAFGVADFGVAGGGNSIEPMRAVIGAMRSRTGRTDPIVIVHTDLPANDFRSIFGLLADPATSYLSGVDEVYAYAAGRSLYGRIFPAG